ncbi:hypothetical protein R5R35_009106 [Gryllus longicercus]|uniref:Tetratricopeptide repeat protein 39C n=1 Tax=Gryllus longicercus TaxID=2509291 RepID=A0AAN9VVJ2_9ORTH
MRHFFVQITFIVDRDFSVPNRNDENCPCKRGVICRGSRCLTAFAVCAGAAGDLEEAGRLAAAVAGPAPAPGTPDTPGGNGGGQLEHFVQRRARRLSIAAAAAAAHKALDADTDAHEDAPGLGPAPGRNGVVAAPAAELPDPADASYCRLLAFELLFLWNALPSCSAQHTARLLEECQSGGKEPMLGLRHLVMGAAQAGLGRGAEAAASFRTCLARRAAAPPPDRDRDAHVAAFALYELGVLLSRDPQTLDEGRQLLRRAQSAYKAYDFENRLSVRIHAALRRCG